MLVTLPDLGVLFSTIEWTPCFPQQKNRSDFTSRAQVIGTPGAEQWIADANALAPADEDEARHWRAFLLSCRGCENTFRLPAKPLRQYTGAQPTVTAAVTGNRAVTVSSSAAVHLGMYATVVQTDGHHRMVGVVGIDGSNVHFEPYLTAGPAIGETFLIGEPYAVVRQRDPNRPLPIVNLGFRLAVEEAL